MNLFKLVGEIFIENEDANRKIADTDSKSKSFASSLGDGLKTAGKWGAGIAAAVGSAAVALAEGTREYRSEMGKLETAFTTSGHTSEAATKTYQDLQAVLGDTGQSVEAANHLAQLCTAEEDLQNWTTICTGVYATFGNSLPVEGLTEAANETAKVGTVTGSLADALNWAGVSEDEFNASLAQCSTEQERQQLITSTLSGLYGEAANAYRETNAEVINANASQEKLNATMAQMGGAVEPVVTSLKTMGAELLIQLMPLVDVLVNEFLPPFMDLINEIFPMLVDLLNEIMPPLIEVAQAILPVIIELFDMLLPPSIEIVEAILPLLLELLGPILELLSPILELLQPFLDIIDAILQPLTELLDQILTPLIAVITELVNLALIPLQAHFQNVANIITQVVLAAFNQINNVINTAKTIFQNLVDFVVNVFTGNWEGAWENIENIFGAVVDYFKNSAEIGKNLIQGIWKGITDNAKWLWDKITGWGQGLLDGMARLFGINSPSKYTREFGQFLVEGLAIGIEDVNHEAQYAAMQLADEVGAEIYRLEETMESVENEIEELEKTKEAADEESQKRIEEQIKQKEQQIDEIKKSVDALKEEQDAWELTAENYIEVSELIGDALKESTSGVNDELETIQLKYDLWVETMGQAATEEELQSKQLEMLNQQLAAQTEVVNMTQMAYDKMVETYGEASEQSQEMQRQLLNEQIEQAKLTNEIAKTNETRQNNLTTKGVSQIISDYGSYLNQNYDTLKQFGISDAEIYGAAAMASGYDVVQTEHKNTVINITQNIGSVNSPAETEKAAQRGAQRAALAF